MCGVTGRISLLLRPSGDAQSYPHQNRNQMVGPGWEGTVSVQRFHITML